ncbi:MAG TPA: hypothetical protein ENJ18_05145 [Nannocystis exedens]|nr:hypothetical protein [Nannocystis exedens]
MESQMNKTPIYALRSEIETPISKLNQAQRLIEPEQLQWLASDGSVSRMVTSEMGSQHRDSDLASLEPSRSSRVNVDRFTLASSGSAGDEIIEQPDVTLRQVMNPASTCSRPFVASPKPKWQLYGSRRCMASPWTPCERARVENGLNFARHAASLVEGVANKWLASSSGTRTQMWHTYTIFVRYFGGYDYQSKWIDDGYRVKVLKRIRNIAEDCRLSTQHFLKIRSQHGTCSKKCSKGYVAYTNAEIIHRTYLCPLFFQNDAYLNACIAGQLLLHEFGHKDNIVNDPVYGRSESIALAAQQGKGFKTARKNADNYAYFFVNFVMDPFLLKHPLDDAKWCVPYTP